MIAEEKLKAYADELGLNGAFSGESIVELFIQSHKSMRERCQTK